MLVLLELHFYFHVKTFILADSTQIVGFANPTSRETLAVSFRETTIKMNIPDIPDYSNFYPKWLETANKFNEFKTVNLDWMEKISKVQVNFDTPFIDISEKINKIFSSKRYLNSLKAIESFNYKMPPTIENLQSTFKSINYDFGKAIEGFEEESEKEDLEETKSESIKEIIFSETARIKDLIFQIYLNNERLFQLHPREFEKLIAELLYSKGFEVELTKQTRDNGYDILALKYMDDFSPVKYLVECKRFNPSRKVGVEIVRSFKEVISTEQANKGIIVTTSYFSSEAIKKQKETPLLLDYKNKDDIIEWVNNYRTSTYR